MSLISPISNNVSCFKLQIDKDYNQFFVKRSLDKDIIIAENSPLDESILVFDIDKHGCNGILNAESSAIQDQELVSYICENCGCHEFELYMQLKYPGDDETCLEIPKKNNYIKPEDLFNWFLLIGKCIRCKAIEEIANWECA